MRITLPDPPHDYSREALLDYKRVLEASFERLFARFEDVVLANGERLILRAPDGAHYRVSVVEDGTLVTAPIVLP